MAVVEPSAPRVVGRYALYGEIAAGGMATVHYGRLLGSVGFARTVAIKRLHPHYARDPEFVSMFLDEARLAARVNHPNVVSTLDVVATAGELFLVMDYVQGESLARLVRAAASAGQRIPPPVVAAIVSGFLHGLHAAHEATNERGEPLQLVHRDVSPQNVLVGVDGVARVVDFGVAKASGRVQTTREGQTKGKLAYMAPEQLQGGAVSRQTDVYAAAIVLWEALTGERLFAADNEAAVVAKLLTAEVRPPSTLAAGIPKELDALTLRALSRSPSARFASARDMALAIERATQVALPSEVGAWLVSLAGATLRARADEVAQIESDSSAMVRASVPDRGGSRDVGAVELAGGRPRYGPAEPTLPAGSGDETRTFAGGTSAFDSSSISSVTASKSTSGPLRGFRPWHGALVVVGVLVALVAVVGFMGLRSADSSGPPRLASPPSAAPEPRGDRPPAEPATEPRPEPRPAESVSDKAPAPSAAKSSAPVRPAPTPRATPPAAPTSAATPVRRSDCNPPYRVDSAGRKIFRSECL